MMAIPLMAMVVVVLVLKKLLIPVSANQVCVPLPVVMDRLMPVKYVMMGIPLMAMAVVILAK